MKIETFELYQAEAVKTMGAHWNDFDDGLMYGALGLCGEAGEIAEHVKKYLSKSRALPEKDELRKEIGDVLWYLASLSKHLGLTLAECAEHNIIKLRKRHGETFSGHGDRSTKEAQ